jgi:hypothetical protein
MIAQVVLDHVRGDGSVITAGVSRVRFRSDDTNSVDNTDPVLLPVSFTSYTVQNITASGSPQEVLLVDETDDLEVGGYLIADPGRTNQEAVAITALEGSTVTAVFTKNHGYGTILQAVTGSHTKYIQMRIAMAPFNSVSKPRFKRAYALPAGVYDQYRLTSDYEGPALFPQVGLDPVPVEWKQIDLNVYQAAGSIPTMVELQWLLTSELQNVETSVYRFGYDED